MADLPDGLKERAATAQYIASNAGALMADLFHKKLRQEQKNLNDYVTELDRSIESMALKSVLDEFPNDGFYGEENVGVNSKNGYEWIVDPIDGTNNYLRGLPLCGFQLAILYNNVTVFGLIHRPFTEEIFTALLGKGAFYHNTLTGEKSVLQVSDRPLAEAIGIFDAEVGKSSNESSPIMSTLADKINTVRVFGTAAFDLPAVAEGSVEFLATGVAKKYDIAAGKLLIEEAGGIAYTMSGSDVTLEDTVVIFSGPQLKAPILQEFTGPSL